MKIITVEMIMKKKPCLDWTEKRVRKYIGKGKTLKEILKISGIDADDKIWCVVQFLPDKTNRTFVIWCTNQCKEVIKSTKDYIKVIKRYYSGKATYEELRVAASRAAYRAASRAAYRAIYWTDDSVMAERNKQIEKLLTLL